MKVKRPNPTVHKVGNLTVINRTGEPFDEKEFIEALKNANVDHLPSRTRRSLTDT